jgi:hypothetical protein
VEVILVTFERGRFDAKLFREITKNLSPEHFQSRIRLHIEEKNSLLESLDALDANFKRLDIGYEPIEVSFKAIDFRLEDALLERDVRARPQSTAHPASIQNIQLKPPHVVVDLVAYQNHDSDFEFTALAYPKMRDMLRLPSDKAADSSI